MELHPTDLKEKTLSELTKHIVSYYHEDLRRRLPELMKLAEKVEKVHGERIPQNLVSILRSLQDEMLMHMMKEENVLFPLIDSGRGHLALMPVKVMFAEHEAHDQNLKELRKITNNFTPPENACNSWRNLYNGLETLEGLLHEHIALENDVLFPRALRG